MRPRLLRAVLRHDLPQLRHHPGLVEGALKLVELLELLLQAGAIDGGRFGDHDLLVAGRLDPLAGDQQLLEQLLPGAQAAEADVDILVGDKTGEPDQLLGEVEDLDRLAHVEEENLPPLPHAPGLQHQLARFRNRHEKARHLPMGDGDRPPLRDLLLEGRHDAAGAAEDIAEADGDETGAAGPGQGLHVELRRPLGRPHHVGRVDRLVGGDHDEGFAVELVGGIGHHPRAAHVVVRRLGRVVLHQRHVLVGGGVKDHLRLALVKEAVDPRPVADIADDGGVAQLRVRPGDLVVNVEEGRLGVVKEDDAGGVKAADLAADLAADAPRGAADEDSFPFQKGPDPLEVEAHRFPAEEVLEVDIPHLLDRDLAVDQVADAGEGLEGDAEGLAVLDNRPHLFARRRGDGDDDLLDPVLPAEGLQLLPGAEDLKAGEGAAQLVGVVIDKTDDRLVQRRVLPDLLGDHLAGAAGADDQGAHPLFAPRPEQRQVVLPKGPGKKARPGEHRQADHPVEDQDRAGDIVEAVDKEEDEDEGDGGDQVGLGDLQHVGHGGIAPPAAEDSQPPEDGDLDQQQERQDGKKSMPVAGGDAEIEAQQVGEQQRGSEDNYLEDEDEPEPVFLDQFLHRFPPNSIANAKHDPSAAEARQPPGDGRHRCPHIRLAQGRMNQEHQAGLPQRPGDGQGRPGTEAGSLESLLKINLTAAPRVAGDAVSIDGVDQPVAQETPLGRGVIIKHLRVEKDVIFVIGVKKIPGGQGQAQSRQAGEAFAQQGGMAAPGGDPLGEAPQLDAANRRLHLGHAHVGAERFVQPAETGRMLAAVNCVKTLAVVLEGPGPLPQGAVTGGQHPPFPAGGHDLVLAKREGRGIAEGTDRPPLVAGAVGLGAVLDDLQTVLPAQLQQRVDVAGPAGEVDGDDRLRPRGDQRTDRFGAQVLAHRIDIGDDRGGAAHDDAARRGDEGAGGGDHLVAGADAVAGEDQLQGDGAVGQGNGVPAVAMGGKFLLEFAPLGAGPVVDPVGEEDLFDGVGLFLGEGGPGGEGGVEHGKSFLKSASRPFAALTQAAKAQRQDSKIKVLT